MLLKSTDNVLALESVSRNPAATSRQLGAILMDEGKLTASDAEQVLARQRELGWRFGEAAIELNLITDADLRQALAKQYEFPYLVSGPDGVAKELIAAWHPFHPTVEELRAVRTQLLMRWFNPEAGRRTLVAAAGAIPHPRVSFPSPVPWSATTQADYILIAPRAFMAQEPVSADSARRDSAKVVLPELTVTVTRTEEPLSRLPAAVDVLDRNAVRRGQATRGLDEALNNLKNDHEFLLQGDVFTEDVVETWLEYKMANEVSAMRLRPHPHEFALYFDA